MTTQTLRSDWIGLWWIISQQDSLFNCEWFKPTLNRGTRFHKQYDIDEVHDIQQYYKFDLFILAQQFMQVYYVSYLCYQREQAN